MTTLAPVNLLGQQLGTGDPRKLHRELYATEVQTKYHDSMVTTGWHINKALSGGKSWRFPVIGTATGLSVHTPGSSPNLSQIKQTYLTVDLDERVYHSVYQDELDEQLADIDARRYLVQEQAVALAKAKDEAILRMMIKAARSPGIIPGEFSGGSTIKNADFKTSTAALTKGMFDAATEFRKRNVDLSSVAAFVSPALHQLLVQNTDFIKRDLGGTGSYVGNVLETAAGIKLIVTNHLPDTDLTTDAAISASGKDPAIIFNKYRADFSKTVAVIASNQAVATVTAVNLDTRFVRKEESFGEYIITSYANGAAVFRPECAIELAIA